MKVSCPACGSKYTIADNKVTGRKVKVRCKSCGGQIVVDGTQSSSEPAPAASPSEAPMASVPPTSAPPSAPAPGAAHAAAPVIPKDAALPSIEWSVNLSDTDERVMTTEQVVAAYHAGELEGEVFVWRDGMADWTLVTEVPELVAAFKASRTPTAPKAQSQAASSPKKTTGSHAAVGAAAPSTDSSPRATGKRAQNTHDLFAAVDRAGGDSDTSHPSHEEAPHKLTGARNESSVLFSLDALKAGIGPVGASKPPQTPKRKLEDLMLGGPGPGQIGGAAAAGPLILASNQALLTAPAPPPPPPPKPEPAPVPATVVIQAPPPKSNRKLIIAGFAIVAVAAAGGSFFAMKGSSDGAVAQASATASAEPQKPPSSGLGTSSASTTTTASAPTTQAAPTETPDASAPAAATVAVAGDVTKTGATQGSTSGSQTSGKGSSSKPKEGGDTKPKEPDKPTAAAAAPAGEGSFNTAAARAALSVAASQATVCRKPDGPTGTGKVLVTFATSGRVTTANVSGAPFGGTAVGGCVSGVFRRAKVPAFSGSPVTVSKSFTISK